MSKEDISAAIEAGKTIGAGTITSIGGVPATITPLGFYTKLYEELMDRPQRTRQVVTVHTAQSFIDYFKAFALTNSAIFFDIIGAQVHAIIDFHDIDSPSWCVHRVRYVCPVTTEWQAWQRSSGVRMSQTEFSYFIENNLGDILTPPGADMLEIASSLRANTKVSFVSSKRVSDGQTQLQYVEKTEGTAGTKGQFDIPEKLELGMRVFEGGDAYEIKAHFRYRIREGELHMWYDLINPDKAKDAAFQSIADMISNEVDCQLIVNGIP